MQEINSFWKGVLNHPPHVPYAIIQGDTLAEAIQQAVNSRQLSVCFRRNRELVDVEGRFRHFLFKGTAYILKITSPKKALEEYINAVKVDQILINAITNLSHAVKVLIPLVFQIDKETAVLVNPDFGITLHERIFSYQFDFSQEIFFNLLTILLEKGIDWVGFVPRNIILNNSNVILFDWEDTYFQESHNCAISDISLFKWILNWQQVYQNTNFEQELKSFLRYAGIKVYHSKLDRFEITYGRIAHIEKYPRIIRKRCERVTFISEARFSDADSLDITPFELGHLIDDLVGSRLSVFYTFATAYLRQSITEENYNKFLRKMVQGLSICLYKAGASFGLINDKTELNKFIMLHLISYMENWKEGILLENKKSFQDLIYQVTKISKICSAILNFISLKFQKGLPNAFKRADLADTIIVGLVDILKNCFTINDKFSIIFRGSFGQSILSFKSDIDFEISNTQYSNGFHEFENTIIDILELFGIEAEGSQKRPLEKDIVSKCGKFSREFHEMSQLRCPNVDENSIGWCTSIFEITDLNFWKKESLYEKTQPPLTAKFIFFSIRDLIARMALHNGFQNPKTSEQLIFLEKVYPEEYPVVYDLLRQSIALYESDQTNHKLILETYRNIIKYKTLLLKTL